MLQETVQNMADKLTRRDGSIEKLNVRIKQLETEIENKEIEHSVTVDQLKKLALHMPPNEKNSKRKWKKTFCKLNSVLVFKQISSPRLDVEKNKLYKPTWKRKTFKLNRNQLWQKVISKIFKFYFVWSFSDNSWFSETCK